MMTLLKFELAKILKKKIVLIGIGAAIILFFIMYNPSSSIFFKTDGTSISGAEATQLNEEIASKYTGEFTDETVRQIYEDYGIDYKNSGKDYLHEGNSTNSTYSIVGRYFLNEDSSLKTIDEVIPGFEGTLTFDYADVWFSTIYRILQMVMILAMVIMVAIAPIFSDEYTSHADSLLLSTRYGKNKCIFAKLAASFIFTSFCFLVLIILSVISLGITNGFDGWDSSIQLNSTGYYINYPFEMNVLTGFILCAVFAWIGLMLLTAITALLSAVMPSSFLAIILSALIYFVPQMLSVQEPFWVRILMLFPSNMAALPNVLGVGNYPVFGAEIKAEVFLPIAAVVFTGLFCTLGYQTFKRHQVK